MIITEGLVKVVIENEKNELRFERLCLDLYYAHTGIRLVPTSQSWDLGRDGRSISSPSNKLLVLCATLQSELDVKVQSDIERLLGTTEIKSLIYCSSRKLSEHAVENLVTHIRDILQQPDVTVEIFGQHQLGKLAAESPEVFQKYYASEIDSILKVFSTDGPRDDGALRLALCTQTGIDAQTLRSDLAQKLVIECLGAHPYSTPATIGQYLGEELHLPNPLPPSYITQVLRQLRDRGLVLNVESDYALTDDGQATILSLDDEAPSRLLELRNQIRLTLEELVGAKLLDSQYDRVWLELQDGLAQVFHAQGLSVVRLVRGILEGTRTDPEVSERELLENLAFKVVRQLNDQSLADEVGQAIVDMFFERENPVFHLLSNIATVYVMMCCLGLEAVSSTETAKSLNSCQLVVDTDVLISLLCEGEENHKETVALLDLWKSIGGRLLCANSSLEEVAYHAWIAENAYFAVESDAMKLGEIGLRHYINNAFVRSFFMLSPRDRARSTWHTYISEFRGDKDRDYGKIRSILQDEFGFLALPEANTEDLETRAMLKEATEFLVDLAAKENHCEARYLDWRTIDKCERDARLVVAVIAGRQALRASFQTGTILVLTSARRLGQADVRFQDRLGQPNAMLSPRAFSYLLTVVPGIRMPFSSIKGVIFDVRLATRVSPLVQAAFRLIAASKKLDLPWSRRKTLATKLHQRLVSDAHSRGLKVNEYETKLTSGQDSSRLGEIVVGPADKCG